MKRALCVLLAVVLIVSMFSGCAGGAEPLRIVIDVQVTSGTALNERLSGPLLELENSLEDTAGITDFVIEIIPGSGAERANMLDRIRTEIMSGEGPDVFIIRNAGGEWFEKEGELLFQMPEKAMELGYFLPLDDYIENAKFADWDMFTPEVMAAGSNREGQQIVPISYALPAVMYRASDFEHIPSDMTWSEMLNSEELYEAAALLGDCYEIRGFKDYPIDYILGRLADFEKDELLFTEEELMKHVTEICELTTYSVQNQLSTKEFCAETGSFGYGFNSTGGGISGPDISLAGGKLNGITDRDTLTLVPFYSDQGGCTAMISVYAAVNRNTRNPQAAFDAIDCLLMNNKFRYSDLYKCFLVSGAVSYCTPIHEGLMSEELPLNYGISFSLTEENLAAVNSVRRQITNAQFSGPLHTVLQRMMIECYTAYQIGEDYTDIVSEAYQDLKIILSE